jgi:hypothetical protein
MRLLSEDIITSARTRGLIPTSQNTFETDDFLQLLNEEAQLKLTPAIMKAREGYFLRSKRVALTAGKSYYPTPERAVGNALVDIWIVDSSGNRTRTVPRTSAHLIQPQSQASDGVQEVMLVGDELLVFPTPATSSGYIEYWYHSRPNQIVATTDCAKITSISSDSTHTTFTVNTDLTADLAVGSYIDIVSGKSPFLLWSEDVAITAITSTTIQVLKSAVVDEASSVEPVVNDYICPARQTNIPMYPEDLHPILPQLLAAACLRSLGHLDKAKMMEEESEKQIQNALALITNRIESEVEPIYNPRGIHSAIGSSGVRGLNW